MSYKIFQVKRISYDASFNGDGSFNPGLVIVGINTNKIGPTNLSVCILCTNYKYNCTQGRTMPGEQPVNMFTV